MRKRWQLVENGKEAVLPTDCAVHPIARTLFANRGIRTEEEMKRFLDPSWEEHVHDPFLFLHMPDAVARLFRAIESGERITVHGDYDADGVTGSAVVISTLREIEKRMTHRDASLIDSYIPHRDKEGYGLHSVTVDYLKERGTSLIVTVDCGIACVNEIAKAKTLGIDTIVVDHHQFGETLPDGILIHPRLPGEQYPFPHLAAVGVAWKLACAVLSEARARGLGIPEGWEKWLLDFVSIATVTDMVPLIGENRVLEVYGLRVMNKTRRPGLRKLIELAGVTPGALTTESIAFSLGPRINAAGRMDHASLALNVLLAESEEEAHVLAARLEDQNKQRQKATAKMMEEAGKQLESRNHSNVLVFWSETWSPALVGLVAGKYLDAQGKPTVAIGKHGDRWVGSGRSFASYDITEAMKRAGDGILTHCGGHVQACGFSFSDTNGLERLLERLHLDAAERLSSETCVPVLSIDAELLSEQIDWQLIETLQKFEPFGEGNKRPVFLTRNLELIACDLVGSTQNHVRCTFRSSSGRIMKCIGFKFGSRIDEFTLGMRMDVVYDVGVNEWNGRKDLQCKLVDVCASAP